MKCPYNINIVQVVQATIEYNDDGKEISSERKLIENRPFIDCIQTECGAWQGGKCTYNDFKYK